MVALLFLRNSVERYRIGSLYPLFAVMDTEDLEPLIGKKVLGVGYERTVEGYVLVLVVRGKEYYLTSQTPMELDIREIH